MSEQNIVNISEANLQQTLQQSMNVPVLFYFWSARSQHCEQLTPVLERLAAQYNGQFTLAKVDCDAEQMLGNLFRESGVVRQLTDTASNALMYIVVILLGTSVGASTSAEAFLNTTTLKIVALGLIAFMFGTAAGVLFGKLLCFLTKGKINPLIGSAGVSAVPMAARVSQKVGAEEDPTNFLLMHAMGPNVAGVIGTAVAAGVFMAIFGI